ncbi:hypothetical protein KFK14_19725 [Sphingobium phenoxybenzoativorans]|uniref:Uncharacterized protein n=1 Tax=Sphingobium phenoxybenzoativorans TaxID=1592790 RepID=A0A975Q1A9_9SPHN|nr:hypothetical protein [Sphingobium phenoxybenzoativorans]QUT05202.1 hypothetical protein KFK14_19725 [Sphingobium phenoxybenzoativorans]
MASQPDHKVVVRRIGSGFSVRIEPPIEGEDLNGDFDSYKNARGWAGGIRMTRGFRLIDETEVGHE